MRREEEKTAHRFDRQENSLTRPLWEEIFREDTEAFLDYYFTEKCRDNEVWGIEDKGGLRAMLHLNPYRFWVGGEGVRSQEDINYIVGVATDREYRHRGYMAALLRSALRDMYRQGQPFTFLMPADERIYLPFDFRYIYNRDVYELVTAEICPGEEVCAAPAKPEDAGRLSEFASECLKKQYGVYAARTADYYRRLFLELQSQNGGILIFTQGKELRGILTYDREEDGPRRVNVQEAIWDGPLLQKIRDRGEITAQFADRPGQAVRIVRKPGRKPIIMARIVRLEKMLSLMRAPLEISLTLRVRDPILVENDGTFLWRLSGAGSSLTRTKEAGLTGRTASAPAVRAAQAGDSVFEVDIAALTQFVFGYDPGGTFSVEKWLAANRLEADEETAEKLLKIRGMGECFINEIV